MPGLQRDCGLSQGWEISKCRPLSQGPYQSDDSQDRIPPIFSYPGMRNADGANTEGISEGRRRGFVP